MSNNSPQQSIAIIGSGISGLTCAYHLAHDYKVSVFEKDARLGGHTDTHNLQIDGEELNIDSGFIVFCREYYPNFSRMLDDLEVESQVTDMSFSAHNRSTGLVYNATSLNRLFCQRKNLVSLRFYRMLLDIIRFYRSARKILENPDSSLTVSEYLVKNNYSETFAQDHLYPMISALWSATPEYVQAYPIRHLVDFLSNHGMMNIIFRPEWRVIKNGSSTYIDAIKKRTSCEWKLNSTINCIKRINNKVIIETSQATEEFDAVIFATHADQALSLLGGQASDDERAILGNITFEKNHVVVHTDENIMHPNKSSWASWNTEVPSKFQPNTLKCCTANYWMNTLQGFTTKTNIFTSLNSHQKIDKNKILQERDYSHPVFTAQSVAAQKQKHLIDGLNNSYYVGAYWGWGFHEDGARSATQVCQKIRTDLSVTTD